MLILYLLEDKALRSIEVCYKFNIGDTEDLENLIFHIRSYRGIPRALIETKYPKLANVGLKSLKKALKSLNPDLMEEYCDFITEVEKQRAVERDYIFDCAKSLTFGFE